MSLVTNDVCNLSCRHCYLVTKRTRRPLSHDEWQRVIRSALEDVQPEALCFAGKEIFADTDSISLLKQAIHIRNCLNSRNPQTSSTRIGLITNGTLAKPYINLIERLQPDWVDVSVDGGPRVHDSIRGTGIWGRVKKNVEELRNVLPGGVWITTTVTSESLFNFAETVKSIVEDQGVPRISVGFFRPTWCNDPSLTISSEEWQKAVDRFLAQLASLQFEQPVRVIFDFGQDQSSLAEALFRRTSFRTLTGVNIGEIELKNGIVLSLRIPSAKRPKLRAVRISVEGYWLHGEDLIDTSRYMETAVVNLADCDFDCMVALGRSQDGTGIDSTMIPAEA